MKASMARSLALRNVNSGLRNATGAASAWAGSPSPLQAFHAAVWRFFGSAAAGFDRGGEPPTVGNMSLLLVFIGIVACLVLCVSHVLGSSDSSDDESEEEEEEGKSQKGTARKDQRRHSAPAQAPSTIERSGTARIGRRRPQEHVSEEQESDDSDDAKQSTERTTDRSSKSDGFLAGLLEEKIYSPSLEEQVANMGISGLCLASDSKDIKIVVLIALQAFSLQAMILYYIAGTLKSDPTLSAEKSLPTILVDAAIYLHCVSCVRDLPLSLCVLRMFSTIHETTLETVLYISIFSIDAIVVPIAQLIIGALFLCTSMTVADVIMNSCAVAYISNIDNMILEVNDQLNVLASTRKDYGEKKLDIPVPVKLVSIVNWTGCIVPILPAAFSCFSGFVGLNVLKL